MVINCRRKPIVKPTHATKRHSVELSYRRLNVSGLQSRNTGFEWHDRSGGVTAFAGEFQKRSGGAEHRILTDIVVVLHGLPERVSKTGPATLRIFYLLKFGLVIL
jgi:hypothetical protein